MAAVLACIVLRALTPAQADEALRFGASPPAGFEDLAGPQETLVDVYYGGHFKLSTLARYDFQTIAFLEPDAVLAQLPELTDSASVTAALSQPLTHNADRLCRYRGQPACGELMPPVAGVIFDESRFRVDVFVAPALLVRQSLFRSRFLPPPSTRFSSVHGLNMSVSGDATTGTAFDLSATSIAAWRENRLHSRYALGNDGFTLSELSLQRDRPGWQYEAGAFRSYAGSQAFFAEQTVIGARMAGSLDLRADLAVADGTPIYLFLTQRSRVDVYRGEQLLDSQFYDAGNQQLDTSRLPDGAYDLTLRTRDAAGRESSQRFFFARSTRLPPLDQPLYFVEAGMHAPVDREATPGGEGGHWLRAGAARRLQTNLGIQAELLSAGSTTVAQTGLLMLMPGWQFEAGLLTGTNKSAGALLRAQYASGQTAIGFDYRSVSSGSASTLLAEDFSQGTLSMSTPVYGGRLFGRAQLEQRAAGSEIAVGLSYRRTLMRRARFALELDFDLSHDSRQTLIRIGARGQWRRDQSLARLSPQFVARFGDTSQGALLVDASVTRNQRGTPLGDLSTNAFVESEIGVTTLGAGIVSQSQAGQFSADINHAMGERGQGLAYSANGRVNVVTGGGASAFGGRNIARAAAIVDVPGDGDSQFNVLVDDRAAGSVRSGHRSVIALRSYGEYPVRIEPAGHGFVEYDEREQYITLYPGNVARLSFRADVVTVVVGQLIDDNGVALANARFDGAVGFAGTDAGGWFQLELREATTLTARHGDGSRCRVRLDTAGAENGLVVQGPVRCVTEVSP